MINKGGGVQEEKRLWLLVLLVRMVSKDERRTVEDS